MLDIRQLRTDPQGVAGNLARRGYSLDLAQFTALETRRKEAQVAVDALRNERNTRSKAIGAAKGKGEDVAALMAEVAGLADELKANEAALAGVQARYTDLALGVPNLPNESVPIGRDETCNV